MISSQTIEEIREKADIVAIISEYVPLKKRGKNYIGLCPFHQEKKPSFTVSPEKQLFHCFGCNEGGNVFAFLMKIENISFSEAAESLAQRLGIRIRKSGGIGITKSEKDKFYALLNYAAKFFQQNLYDKKVGEKALKYIKLRGIQPEIVELMKLGYAPESWDALLRYLIGKGGSPSDIEKAGVIIKKEGVEGYYDRFRNRLIFPILDLRDRIIGFGGRALDEETEPKYINSPDSPIYNKGESLYGLNLSKGAIRESGQAILVEGYMDFISCYQYGLKNVVAPLGTALTLKQAQVLRRLTGTTVLAFDADTSGSQASERNVEILREADLTVKVAVLKEGKDPDEVLKNKGVGYFSSLIQGAIPWMEFKISLILDRYKLSEAEGRARAIKEAAVPLAKEKDHLVQGEYVKLLAQKTNIEKDAIWGEVRRVKYYLEPKGREKTYLKRVTQKPGFKIIKAEQNLLRLALEGEKAYNRLREDLTPSDFTDPHHCQIAEALFSVDFRSTENIPHWLLENLPSPEARKVLSKILLSEYPLEDEERIMTDCLNTLKAHQLKSRLEDLRLRISQAEKAQELNQVTELHREFNECSQLVRSLEKS